MTAATPWRWVFLPGLDGTGLLFEEILKRLPQGVHPTVVSYPSQTPSDAAELGRLIDASLPAGEPFVLVAESFSGPLALRAISGHRGSPVALVLCSSFGRSPISKLASSAMRKGGASVLLHCRIPTWLIRRFLVGDAPDGLVQMFRRAIAELSDDALVSRFKVLDEFTDAFVPRTLSLPILYVRARQDRLVHESDLAWLQERFSNLTVREVDSPHLVLQCQPQQVVELILDFLHTGKVIRRNHAESTGS